MSLFPPSGGADQAVGNQAEPKVDDHADVELEWAVARQRERRREQEIRHVAEDDGAESLDQIQKHRGFRHWGHGQRAFEPPSGYL